MRPYQTHHVAEPKYKVGDLVKLNPTNEDYSYWRYDGADILILEVDIANGVYFVYALGLECTHFDIWLTDEAAEVISLL